MPRQKWAARAGIALVLTVAAGTVAGPAQAAATVSGSAKAGTSTVTFEAGTATNKVVVTRSGRTVTIDDRVAIRPGKGCKKVKGDKTKVRCTTKKTPTKVYVELRDRNDSVVNKSDLRMEADGGDGNDKLTGGPKDDFLTGDNIFTRYDNGNDKIYGGGGDDEIYAGEGADYVNAGEGNDTVHGDAVCECYGPHRPGNDVIYGGRGNDFLVGMAGNDKIYGGHGHDILLGLAGRDRLEGGAGNDEFVGDHNAATAVADVLLGGPGTDEVSYSGYAKPVTVDLDGVADDGLAGERDLVGADIENIYGGSRNDRLTGNNAANAIDGAAGDDVIFGGGGNDQLDGTEGRNKLYGEAGNDTLDSWSDNKGSLLDGGIGTDNCRFATKDTLVGCETSATMY
ncbi:Ca2+-binding RTX toxin-like protein [Actinoplanes lutulentus]|uniref:Hemolysin type calcium-binding protein n=1 Tax=Actinoplanes lutulentus TaxID=1287878 RepID=A0A327Z5U0_9ACTN|nr:calcium-binding protein [Actinoplanes lutulentus]MBB2943201.1 Ca2+-binding RTX toxin-like protein [Actinoplanes lutulentus]RAK28267.1 hemolysin type calcium-binding protein [Actinoplanes lutulentus]